MRYQLRHGPFWHLGGRSVPPVSWFAGGVDVVGRLCPQLLLILLVVVAAVLAKKKIDQSRSEQALWAEATDTVDQP